MFAVTLLCLAANPDVPNVALGPESAENALRVDAPVARVTVFADRARVTRRGTVSFPRGVTTLGLPDVIGAAFVDSIRVTVEGAKVIRVESAPVLRERFGIESAEKLLKEIEALDVEIDRAEARQALEQREIATLSSISPAMPVPEAGREGRPLMVLKPEAWLESQRVLSERRARSAERSRQTQDELEKLGEKRARLVEEVSRQDLGGFTDRKIAVLVLVDAPREGRGEVELEYFVPAAKWTPAYSVIYDASKGEVELKIAGNVSQASGESWKDVAIELSTAVPGVGIAMPELLTWTLGEKRDFLPVARPLTGPRPQPPVPGPIVSPRAEETARALRLSLLRERLAVLAQGRAAAAQHGAEFKKKTMIDFEGAEISGELSRPSAGYRQNRARPSVASPRPSAPPPPAPPSMAPAATIDDAISSYGSVMTLSVAAESSSQQSMYTRQTSMGLHDPADFGTPSLGPVVDPGLLGLPGGFEYVFKSPASIDVASTGEFVRVPLETERFTVDTFYEATPSISPVAYLRAKVKNRGTRPILAGPAEIFVGRDFAGEGQIATTGPGGQIELPLGADEDIKLLRRVVPKTETEGFLSKSDVTTYSVEIDVASSKRKPISIVVRDQVPKSRMEDIDVKFLGADPAPFETTAEGVMSFRVELAPAKTRTIKLRYQISRPRDWQLYQR
ncbi:MAG: mucoidy inhibitor MuiA family protein [Deltaproteobacteria bacterium]|nr:mucoidy inhibitor MuiA family protein [Deltaproteobacteria bacterium]